MSLLLEGIGAVLWYLRRFQLKMLSEREFINTNGLVEQFPVYRSGIGVAPLDDARMHVIMGLPTITLFVSGM